MRWLLHVAASCACSKTGLSLFVANLLPTCSCSLGSSLSRFSTGLREPSAKELSSSRCSHWSTWLFEDGSDGFSSWKDLKGPF
eukprot:s1179_g24.t1